jgi:hypothetical protein
MRVAILLHPGQRRVERIGFRIWALQRVWEARGIEVVHVRGSRKEVDADVLIPHLDLTVVPEEYHELLDTHRNVVNRRVRDVSKRRISRNLVGPEDAYDGPVIVKTDRNYGGLPEVLTGPAWVAALRLLAGRWRRLGRAAYLRPYRYPVFPSVREVPAAVFRDPRLVVERFLPEIEGGRYHTRVYSFFGDRHTCTRRAGPRPVVKAPMSELLGECPVPDGIVAERRRLGFDYGKFDFVLHDGQPVLLDANPTPSLPRRLDSATARALVANLAEGLFSFTPR